MRLNKGKPLFKIISLLPIEVKNTNRVIPLEAEVAVSASPNQLILQEDRKPERLNCTQGFS